MGPWATLLPCTLLAACTEAACYTHVLTQPSPPAPGAGFKGSATLTWQWCRGCWRSR